jgi:pimeloyl-ACP methyl ester carboxylesterase
MAPTTYVLIPGAWHGAWSWRPVARRLREAGHRAIATTLPGLGDGDDPTGLRLHHAVDYIVGLVTSVADGEVILVGHSWAGYPLAGAMARLTGRVTKAVFYNAQIPLPGRSMIADNPPHTAQLLTALIAASPTRAIAPALRYVEELFMQDVAPEAQHLLAGLLTPQPGQYFLDAIDTPAVATLGIPTAYLLSDDDHALPRTGREFADRLGVRPIRLPGTHESLLTHPDDVTRAILHA